MNEKSDRFKGPQHAHSCTVEEFEQLFLAIFGRKLSAECVDQWRSCAIRSGSSRRASVCATIIATISVVKEKQKQSAEYGKKKISHNHSIGMTINGRNLLCGLKLLFSVCSYNNLGFYGLVMDSQTAMW